MKRLVVLCALFLSALPAYSQPYPAKTFMERTVNLTIQSSQGGPKFTKKTTPNKVREAVTAFNGKEKATQVYLIQRFLADARANVEMTLKIDEDVYELNNRNPKDPETLNWTINLSDEPRAKKLSNLFDEM